MVPIISNGTLAPHAASRKTSKSSSMEVETIVKYTISSLIVARVGVDDKREHRSILSRLWSVLTA